MRTRNLFIIGTACITALILVGLGLSLLGLGALALGALAYTTRIARDSVDKDYLKEVFAIGETGQSGDDVQDSEDDEDEPREPPMNLDMVDPRLRKAFDAVMSRRCELRDLLGAGPPMLKASLSETNRICDNILGNARRLVVRGQRLNDYLRNTSIDELSSNACEAVLQVELTNDLSAARTYRQIAAAKQVHIETHIELEGLYDGVLAQLLLIETTLAGAVAKLVKITSVEDAEPSLTASLVREELEQLMSDVLILETSIEEVA
jgi:hypothetical protein